MEKKLEEKDMDTDAKKFFYHLMKTVVYAVKLVVFGIKYIYNIIKDGMQKIFADDKKKDKKVA